MTRSQGLGASRATRLWWNLASLHPPSAPSCPPAPRHGLLLHEWTWCSSRCRSQKSLRPNAPCRLSPHWPPHLTVIAPFFHSVSFCCPDAKVTSFVPGSPAASLPSWDSSTRVSFISSLIVLFLCFKSFLHVTLASHTLPSSSAFLSGILVHRPPSELLGVPVSPWVLCLQLPLNGQLTPSSQPNPTELWDSTQGLLYHPFHQAGLWWIPQHLAHLQQRKRSLSWDSVFPLLCLLDIMWCTDFYSGSIFLVRTVTNGKDPALALDVLVLALSISLLGLLQWAWIYTWQADTEPFS